MVSLKHLSVVAMLVFSVLTTGKAYAGNAACWDDDSRVDISCTRITEDLLLSFRGQTQASVRKTMQAVGRETGMGTRFISNYARGEKTGSGGLNVVFDEGRVVVIRATVDTPANGGRLEFIWNAHGVPPPGEETDRSTRDFSRSPFCSDLSARPQMCTRR